MGEYEKLLYSDAREIIDKKRRDNELKAIVKRVEETEDDIKYSENRNIKRRKKLKMFEEGNFKITKYSKTQMELHSDKDEFMGVVYIGTEKEYKEGK